MVVFNLYIYQREVIDDVILVELQKKDVLVFIKFVQLGLIKFVLYVQRVIVRVRVGVKIDIGFSRMKGLSFGFSFSKILKGKENKLFIVIVVIYKLFVVKVNMMFIRILYSLRCIF